MNHKFRFTATALAIAGLFPITSYADTEMPAMVVTATRQAQRVNELVSDVTLIQRNDIEKMGPGASLGELLSRVPGLEMSRAGGRGASESLFIRGANSGHTLVLLDGFRVGSATLGETALAMIPLSQIERIEVLRGPGSSLYGTDAIGGVINIQTRTTNGKPFAQIGWGDHDTFSANAGVSGSSDGFSYSIKAGRSSSTGVSGVVNTNSAAYNPDRDGYWRNDGSVQMNYKLSNTLEVGGQYLESFGDNKYDSSWPSANFDWRRYHKVSAAGAYTRAQLSDNWSSTWRVGRGVDDTVDTPSSTSGQAQDNYRTSQDQYMWQNDIKLPVGMALVVLERLDQNVASSENYSLNGRTIDSLSVGWNGRVDRHRMQFNMRHDHNSQFGNKTTGTAGYGYQINSEWRVATTYGTAFKAPTLNDLYYPNRPFVGVGNPNLVPEFARNREIALFYEQDEHVFSVTTFRNEIENLISWDETTPGSWFYTPKNIGQAKIDGLSAAYRGRYANWTVSSHLDFQDPKDANTGNMLNRRAKQFGGLAIDRDMGAWRIGMDIQGVGTRYDDIGNTRRMGGYTVLNAHASYNLGANWSIFMRLDNVLNKHYESARSSTTFYATPGASYFIGLRYAPK